MMQVNLKGVSNIQESLKPQNIPNNLIKKDQEWLVVEHYMDPNFQIKSAIDSENRAQLNMLPRTSSRPIQDVIYEDLDNILEELEKKPSISQFELMEKCFGPHDRDRVMCFGLGMKPKDVRAPEPCKADMRAQLQTKISTLTS